MPDTDLSPASRVFLVLKEAKKLAREYRALTGKPLGITGEVAEYEAARLLDLQLTPARNAGYDAIDPRSGKRFQIKGRCLPERSGAAQRLGGIDIGKEFDAVLLVLLNEDYDAVAMYEAERAAVVAAITAPGSKARNDRNALLVAQFKRIGRCLWPS